MVTLGLGFQICIINNVIKKVNEGINYLSLASQPSLNCILCYYKNGTQLLSNHWWILKAPQRPHVWKRESIRQSIGPISCQDWDESNQYSLSSDGSLTNQCHQVPVHQPPPLSPFISEAKLIFLWKTSNNGR